MDFTAAERVALRFAEQFATHSAGITDELVSEVEQHLGTAGAVELALDQACALDDGQLAASS